MAGPTSTRIAPETAWTVVTDSPLKGLALAREAGTILAWDEGNQLYLLNVQGESLSYSRVPHRILAGAIRATFQARILEITADFVRVESPAGPESPRADAVFPLIGYQPDFALFERCGIRLEGPLRVPAHDSDTLESNVPGLYLAGAILGGTEVGHIFIENSRHHASRIAGSIEARLGYVPA